MHKLSTKTVSKPPKLSRKTEVPFIVSFKYPLDRKYNFTALSKSDVAAFQRFLDKVSKMTFDEVDKAFLRPTDKRDIFNESQVIHYKITDSFRVHGVIEHMRFKVLRLDPNHKVHS